MRAWTVDADDIRVAEDFDESLLHRTPEIDGFLIPIGTTSSSSSAPRGSERRCSSRPSGSSTSGTGGRHACPSATFSTSRSATRSSAGRRSRSSPRRRFPWSKMWLTAIASRHAQAPRRGWTASRSAPKLAEPDRRRAAPQRHRPFRPSPRFHRRASFSAAPPTPTGTSCRGCGPSSRRWPSSSTASTSTSTSTSRASAEPAERHRRAVAERVALRAARPRRGRLSAAPHQPSPEGVRRGAQGGVRAPPQTTVMSQQYRGSAVDIVVLPREPARDLRQQHPAREGRPDGPSGATARRPARGLPRANEGRCTPTRARRRTPSSTSAGTRCCGRAT